MQVPRLPVAIRSLLEQRESVPIVVKWDTSKPTRSMNAPIPVRPPPSPSCFDWWNPCNEVRDPELCAKGSKRKAIIARSQAKQHCEYFAKKINDGYRQVQQKAAQRAKQVQKAKAQRAKEEQRQRREDEKNALQLQKAQEKERKAEATKQRQEAKRRHQEKQRRRREAERERKRKLNAPLFTGRIRGF